MFNVANTDEQAFADTSTLPPLISLVDQNKAIAEGVLQSGDPATSVPISVWCHVAINQAKLTIPAASRSAAIGARGHHCTRPRMLS
jgi:hypothetical protein